MQRTNVGIDEVHKSYGKKRALKGVSFEAPPGQITALVGNNGAGKTTLLRVLLGLAAPDKGKAHFDGTPYNGLAAPVKTVGAVLESSGAHPTRSGRNHLRITALRHGIAETRIDHVLEVVDLTQAARLPVRKYSFGMRQRLSIAHALLGDPGALVLDEPSNGLDPGGIRWLGQLLRGLADEGRTVLVSSHHLAEVEKYMDRAVVMREGEIAAILGPEELRHNDHWRVRSADDAAFTDAAVSAGAHVRQAAGEDGLLVSGMTSEQLGALALSKGIALFEITAAGGVIDQLLDHASAREES